MMQVSLTFCGLAVVVVLLSVYGLAAGRPASLIERVEQERAKRAILVGGVPYVNPAVYNANGGVLVNIGDNSGAIGYANGQPYPIAGLNAGRLGYLNALFNNTVGNGTFFYGGDSSWGSMSSEGIFIVNNNNNNNKDTVTDTPTTSTPGRKRRAIALANAPYYAGGSSDGIGYVNGPAALIPGVNVGGFGYYNRLPNTVGNGTVLLGGGSSWGSMSSEGIFIVNNNGNNNNNNNKDAVADTPTTSTPGRKRRAIALANTPYYAGGNSEGIGYMNGQPLIAGLNVAGIGNSINGLTNAALPIFGSSGLFSSESMEGLIVIQGNNNGNNSDSEPTTASPVDLTQNCACTPSQCVTYLMLQESCMGSLGDITRCEKKVDLDFLCDELRQRLGLPTTPPSV